MNRAHQKSEFSAADGWRRVLSDFEVWLYPDTITEYDTVLSKWIMTGWEWWFKSNRLQFLSNGGSITTNEVFSTGQWYHVVISKQNTEAKVFVNGDFDNIATISSIDTTNKVFQIGATNAPLGYYDYYFDGLIDEVRIYNRALSGTEVNQHYLVHRREIG